MAPLLPILFSTVLIPLAFSSPLSVQQSVIPPTLIVTSFRAFFADPYIEGPQSNLSFHIRDPRPAPLGAEVDCVIPNTYFQLYAISALFAGCGEKGKNGDGRGEWEKGFSYRFVDGALTVRRAWWENETTYVTGSSTQPTNWAEQDPGANVTKYPEGLLRFREEEWLFPIASVQPTTPP